MRRSAGIVLHALDRRHNRPKPPSRLGKIRGSRAAGSTTYARSTYRIKDELQSSMRDFHNQPRRLHAPNIRYTPRLVTKTPKISRRCGPFIWFARYAPPQAPTNMVTASIIAALRSCCDDFIGNYPVNSTVSVNKSTISPGSEFSSLPFAQIVNHRPLPERVQGAP